MTRAARANRLAQPGASAAQLARAEELARGALRLSPVSVPAVRALADAAALRGDLPRADRLFAYSERLSRRDLLTQMWLIEERVRHGDVGGALVHYDRALKTSLRARAVLFPVLVGAAADPVIARGLGLYLSRGAAWGPDFLAVMAEAPAGSPDALGRLLLAARLRPDVAAQRGPLGAGVARLVATGRYGAAYAAYARAVKAPRVAAPVRDGGFEADPLLPPFDWSLAAEGDLSASREPAVGGGTELVLRAANGRGGELARQLTLLRPGRYRLALTASRAGRDPVARAAVTIACAAGGGELVRVPLSSAARMRLGGVFAVPAGCPAQWVVIAAPAGLSEGEGAGDPPTADDLSIVPADAR